MVKKRLSRKERRRLKRERREEWKKNPGKVVVVGDELDKIIEAGVKTVTPPVKKPVSQSFTSKASGLGWTRATGRAPMLNVPIKLWQELITMAKMATGEYSTFMEMEHDAEKNSYTVLSWYLPYQEVSAGSADLTQKGAIKLAMEALEQLPRMYGIYHIHPGYYGGSMKASLSSIDYATMWKWVSNAKRGIFMVSHSDGGASAEIVLEDAEGNRTIQKMRMNIDIEVSPERIVELRAGMTERLSQRLYTYNSKYRGGYDEWMYGSEGYGGYGGYGRGGVWDDVSRRYVKGETKVTWTHDIKAGDMVRFLDIPGWGGKPKKLYGKHNLEDEFLVEKLSPTSGWPFIMDPETGAKVGYYYTPNRVEVSTPAPDTSLDDDEPESAGLFTAGQFVMIRDGAAIGVSQEYDTPYEIEFVTEAGVIHVMDFHGDSHPYTEDELIPYKPETSRLAPVAKKEGFAIGDIVEIVTGATTFGAHDTGSPYEVLSANRISRDVQIVFLCDEFGYTHPYRSDNLALMATKDEMDAFEEEITGAVHALPAPGQVKLLEILKEGLE